ncbi:MAG: VOC family protein [Acidobacteria bacterium]|nr:VOC family protein [Acidobacteriota bacterium]
MSEFEMGRLSRRDVLLTLSALAMGTPRVRAQAPSAPIVAQAMNHVTLTVTDPKRSLAFYQRVFGLSVVAYQGPVPIVRIGSGPQFIALSGGPTATPRIDHLCLTVPNFDADRIMKTLADLGVAPAPPPGGGGRGGATGQGGVTPGTGQSAPPPAGGGGLSGGPLRARVRMRGENAGGAREGTPEIYFGDPDGIVIQLQDPRYCGGAGVLGEVCSAAPREVSAPIVAREMNHVALFVSDPKRSLDFYQRVFGLPVVANQGATPILRIGPGPSFIALAGGPTATPRIDHVCLTVENFDVDRIVRTLGELGLKKADGFNAGPLTFRVRMRGPEAGGAKEGTPEIYFTDPDGLTIQIQDATYCGGAGVPGNVCKG